MKIRKMVESDTAEVLAMMRVFYASAAVHTNGSEEIFLSDIKECIDAGPYAEGYVFDDCGAVAGYAMLAKSFSTEFGKRCIWIEDIYLKEQYRGMGIAGEFISFVKEKYSDSVIRLEAEEENECAVKAYLKAGFEPLPYLEMIKR